ncbi:capZ-interacting protein isoform X2 [Phyllobates terribilis]|uniref:capZ-interacting protein isoform X2 n=1 Tax=Phyllobates terribilis TaxID=111132 RepID=UPI003CCB3DBA
MEGKSVESSATEESAPPSVAKLAGLFGDTFNSPRKEVPPHKPTRRKPPCSLPLPKPEITNNGDEKLSPPQSQVPKIKVKSSPLIEKLQANLAFAPASLLPGPSPKSPGLKTMASPWGTPPSTPSSPGVQPHSSSTEESPVSFEQPPEGTHLQSYNKVRTRGSLKRRPPSRRFRKSQSDMDFDIETSNETSNETAKENGDKSDEGDIFVKDKEDGEASPVTEKSPSESADKTSENPKSNQEDSAKQEEAVEEKQTETEEKSDREEEKSCTSETVTPDVEQEMLNIEEKSEDPGDQTGLEDKEESNEQKSDGDDKPEK